MQLLVWGDLLAHLLAWLVLSTTPGWCPHVPPALFSSGSNASSKTKARIGSDVLIYIYYEGLQWFP